MNISRKLLRIIPHLLGCGALFLVVLQQNDLSDWDFEDYYILGFFWLNGHCSLH